MHLQNQDREPKFGTWMYQRPVSISKSRSRCQPQLRTSSVLQSPNQDLKNIHLLRSFKIKIENRGVSKISNHIQNKTGMPNCSMKSSKGQVKTGRTLVKMKSQNLEHGYTKDQCSDNFKILIKILNPIQKLFQPKANHCKAELVY